MKEKIKILYLKFHITDFKVGGSYTHTVGVINSFAKMCDIDVISNDEIPDVKIKYEIVPPVRFFEKVFSKKSLVLLDAVLYNLKIIKRVIPYIKNKNYDFIYQRYNPLYSFSASFLSKKYNIPLVLEYNGSPAWILKHWGTKDGHISVKKKFYRDFVLVPFYSFSEIYNLRVANLIVVVSGVMRRGLMERGICGDRILVNPNGVDVERFRPGIDGGDVVRRYGLEGRVVLGFVGTFGPWHGVDVIVDAYSMLLREHPRYRGETKLLLIGDGVMMGEVRRRVKEYGIVGNVEFTGFVSPGDVPRYLSVCDILINAPVRNPDGSEFFGSPTKLFEYMAMGKAIISSDIGQMREVLRDGETAVMFRAGDSVDLARAMRVVIEDEFLRRELGRRAREEAVRNYTWDKHVERILKAFQNLKNKHFLKK